MKLDSKIKMVEELDNKERKFGSCLAYYPAYVVMVDGKEVPALFTIDQLNDAMGRASRNPEDMPKESGNFFNWLFG